MSTTTNIQRTETDNVLSSGASKKETRQRFILDDFSPLFHGDRRTFGTITASAVVAVLFSGNSAAATVDSTTIGPPLSPPPVVPTDMLQDIGSNETTSISLMDYCSNTQFNTANDVPAEYFTDQRYIYGFVERVIDGDTIRIRHIPGYGMGASRMPEPLKQRGIANVTLSVRIYGVDCPETGKNKRHISMPFGEDAKEFTSDMVFHKMVKVTLLRRDQYNRCVAVVETVPDSMWGRLVTGSKDLSLELATAGLAELYTGGGAVYYNKRDELEAAIASAQRKKRGIWSLENRQSAADYKRHQKAAATLQREPPRGGGGPLLATTSQNKKPLTEKPTHNAVAQSNKNSNFSRRPSNKENLLDAVITGLEFVG